MPSLVREFGSWGDEDSHLGNGDTSLVRINRLTLLYLVQDKKIANLVNSKHLTIFFSGVQEIKCVGT